MLFTRVFLYSLNRWNRPPVHHHHPRRTKEIKERKFGALLIMNACMPHINLLGDRTVLLMERAHKPGKIHMAAGHSYANKDLRDRTCTNRQHGRVDRSTVSSMRRNKQLSMNKSNFLDLIWLIYIALGRFTWIELSWVV
jgi:hypothetical protein